MIYEYAVSPDLFGNPANLNLLFQAFEPGSGRIISDYPKRKWIQYARDFIKRSIQEESEQKAWIELLISLDKYSLVQRQGPLWDDQLNWIKNALNEHHNHHRPFWGILNEKEITNEEDVIPIGVSIHSHNKWKVPPTRSVTRSATKLLESVTPLINMSNTLILIDRNFNPSEGYFSKVLVAFADYLLKIHHQPKIQQIKFVTTYEDNITKETKEQFEKRCRKYLPELLPSGIEVKFHLKVKKLLHPRFVLTNIGGVLFDWGLDESDKNDEKPTIISRLSIDDFNLEWKQWNQKVIHHFTISGLKNLD